MYDLETMALNGVLLEIEKVDFMSNNNTLIEGPIHRSGFASAGVEVEVHYKDNKWKTKEAKIIGIS